MPRTKQEAITRANLLQKHIPARGPYFVMSDNITRNWIVLTENEFLRECDIDYTETQAQTIYDTWT